MLENVFEIRFHVNVLLSNRKHKCRLISTVFICFVERHNLFCEIVDLFL